MREVRLHLHRESRPVAVWYHVVTKEFTLLPTDTANVFLVCLKVTNVWAMNKVNYLSASALLFPTTLWCFSSGLYLQASPGSTSPQHSPSPGVQTGAGQSGDHHRPCLPGFSLCTTSPSFGCRCKAALHRAPAHSNSNSNCSRKRTPILERELEI